MAILEKAFLHSDIVTVLTKDLLSCMSASDRTRFKGKARYKVDLVSAATLSALLPVRHETRKLWCHREGKTAICPTFDSIATFEAVPEKPSGLDVLVRTRLCTIMVPHAACAAATWRAPASAIQKENTKTHEHEHQGHCV